MGYSKPLRFLISFPSFCAGTEMEVKVLTNSLGRKWDLTFTTLVTFGGAAFASFPLFYSTSFGGAYWVWMIILFAFILQAVSYEYRSKASNLLGTKTYDAFLYINGLLSWLSILDDMPHTSTCH